MYDGAELGRALAADRSNEWPRLSETKTKFPRSASEAPAAEAGFEVLSGATTRLRALSIFFSGHQATK